MRKKIIAANWKMHMTVEETEKFWESFNLEIEENPAAEIVLVPPFTALPRLAQLVEKTQKVRLGAQNMHFEISGAFTGEISPAMLRELYVRYVILGHSERRSHFGETDELINRKVRAALRSELRPILCVGESLDEREAGREKNVLEAQLRAALAEVEPQSYDDLIVAYEPVWAIGTGRNATPEQAGEAHHFIRSILGELAGAEVAAKVRIQYGGSVKPANARDLLAVPDIDGALVGGASLEPRGFAAIVHAAKPAEEESRE